MGRKYKYFIPPTFIYSITNTKNGKVYIGRTTNPQQRFVLHRNRMIAGTHPCELMNIDCKKYGIESFRMDVLEEVKEGSYGDAEFKYIFLNKSYDPAFGYNYKDRFCYCNGKMTSRLKKAIQSNSPTG